MPGVITGSHDTGMTGIFTPDKNTPHSSLCRAAEIKCVNIMTRVRRAGEILCGGLCRHNSKQEKVPTVFNCQFGKTNSIPE